MRPVKLNLAPIARIPARRYNAQRQALLYLRAAKKLWLNMREDTI
jgi:hypothetical protein